MGLHLIDAVLTEENQNFRYVSALAKTVHVWRDSARGMYAAWEAVHGPVAAYDNGKKLPPRCLSGRWMSVATVGTKLDSVAGRLPAVRVMVLLVRAFVLLVRVMVLAQHYPVIAWRLLLWRIRKNTQR